MSLTPPLEEGKCLCLYPGSGAAVLPIATGTRVETTFALGSYNEDIIRANLELNEASGEHSFLKALGPTVKGPYDVIFAAPPSAFEPAEIKMPKFIAGGKDGLKFVRQVLSKSEKLLAPGGKLLMTFMFFSESDSKVMRERLKSFLDETGLGYTAIVSGKHLMQPGVPIFNMMFGAVATGKEAAGEVIATQMLNHVKEMKFEAAYLIKGTFQSMAENVPRELVDYSELYYGAWSF